MQATGPHYLLYSEVNQPADGPRWRFVLQSTTGDNVLVAADKETNIEPSRLELLAVVRGLEALAQPSRVTLLTRSRYVSRGIRRGLTQWRERGWRWDRFGQLVPIRDHDLWQRVDRALQFHRVDCWPSPFPADTAETTFSENAGRAPEPNIATGDMTAARVPTAGEPALLVLPRRATVRSPRRPPQGRFLRTLDRLRQSVLAPLTAFWRPAFTRAA